MAYNIENYPLHWALGGSDTSGGLEQNAYELEKLCDFMKEHNIQTYLEIGIAQGYLLRFMENEMGLDAMGVTLDRYRTHKDLRVIYCKSQDFELLKNVDLIFVDGAHDYESVKSDYERFKGKCKYMAFHDACGRRSCEGVKKLWDEIKDKHEHWFFVDANEKYQSGIAIIKIK